MQTNEQNETAIELINSDSVELLQCPACNGSGTLIMTHRAWFEPDQYPHEVFTCLICDGTGYYDRD